MTYETVSQKPHFDVVMRGYERAQVDEYFSRLQRETSQLTANLRQERDFARNGSQQLVAERDNALRQLHAAQQELEKLRRTAAETTVELKSRDEVSLFGHRLNTILTTAEQEAKAAKAEAEEAASRIREEAEREAETVRTQAQQEADTLLTETRQEAETVRIQARQEADRLLADARRHAAEVTERANAEAERVTTSAHEEATTTLDAARREERETRTVLAELVRRREQVRRELTAIGAAIESLLDDGGTAPQLAQAPRIAIAERPQPSEASATEISATGISATGTPNTEAPNAEAPNAEISNAEISDTGTPNTGISDTGTPNTGISDTGISDTGISDTGTSSAGAPDTETSNTTVAMAVGAVRKPATKAEETTSPAPQTSPQPQRR
jgi:cell division septum initiation protein DivIVA